jgi:hypothetical protein
MMNITELGAPDSDVRLFFSNVMNSNSICA